jgi:hypothetical protein
MKKVKIRFALPSGNFLNLNFPILALQGLSFPKKVAKMTTYTSLLVFFIWFFLLFFATVSTINNTDYLGFKYFLIGTLALAGLFLVQLLLRGKKILLDPPGFLAVLVFALATTTTSVLVTPANISNTFGGENFKALSGLVIMSALGLFYFTQLYVFNKTRFLALLNTIIVSLILFLGYLLLGGDYSAASILLLVATLPLLGGITFYYKKYSFIYFLIAIVDIVLIFDRGLSENNPLLKPIALPLSLTLFVASLLVILFVIFSKFEILKKETIELAELKTKYKDLKTWKSVGRKLLYFVVLLSPILVFGYLIYLVQNDYSLKSLFENAIDDLEYAWERIRIDNGNFFEKLRTLIVGLGIAKANTSNSLLSNILLSQGILGLVSYIFIWTFAISKASKLLSNMIEKNDWYKVIASFVIVLIFVPLFSIFAYPSIFLVALWWILFSLLIAFSNFIDLKKERVYTDIGFSISDINFRKRNLGTRGLYLKYLLSIGVLVLTFLLGYGLIDVLNEIKY